MADGSVIVGIPIDLVGSPVEAIRMDTLPFAIRHLRFLV